MPLRANAVHSYSQNLASFVWEKWNDVSAASERHCGDTDPLPPQPVLDYLLSSCYQASLMREEERTVTFRLMLRDPSRFIPGEGPPAGLHRLIFTHPRPFNEHELRRLSPASDYYRSIIGVKLNPQGELQIWGMVHSGPRWVQTLHGGRGTSSPLPSSLVVCVTGAGRLSVCQGSRTIATLSGGMITRPSLDVFDSKWLPEAFAGVRAEVVAQHAEARARATEPWAPLEPRFTGILAQHVMRRLISVIRNARHGGTLLFLPPERAREFACENRFMSIKYKFMDEEPRQRFRTLIVGITNALAEVYGGRRDEQRPVGWHEYMTSTHETLSDLNEAIFELAHLLAGLTSVDGAVILTKRWEVLGFGGEISGDLENVTTVARALDAEGERTEIESTESVGTRHRSVYRLCNQLSDVVAVVVSQDGDVRFVKRADGIVTYWEQVSTSVLDT